MTEHLRSLINNKLMSDVTFIVEGAEIFAHKCIIIRSGYFRTLLSGEFARRKTVQVEISDVSREVFLILLEFVYTDCVGVSGSGVKELFVAAHCCGIESLKNNARKNCWTQCALTTLEKF
ncbi:hypothetical protein V7S43_000426 [Phytophthora oleae]|uniref:BTB domain-containing protein n=1 Tax=Phytophthora oleae TaxID=2107226 RepID=A0ABD3G5R2_9STRA